MDERGAWSKGCRPWLIYMFISSASKIQLAGLGFLTDLFCTHCEQFDLPISIYRVKSFNLQSYFVFFKKETRPSEKFDHYITSAHR